MAIPAPDTHWELLALDQDVAEPLAVAALCEVGLALVCFNLYSDVTEAGKGDFPRLLRECPCH